MKDLDRILYVIFNATLYGSPLLISLIALLVGTG